MQRYNASSHGRLGKIFKIKKNKNLLKWTPSLREMCMQGLGMRQAEERPVLPDSLQDSVWEAVVTG